jgi:hypothetical protein
MEQYRYCKKTINEYLEENWERRSHK